jgi:serine/threonine-protein kinase RsbW
MVNARPVCRNLGLAASPERLKEIRRFVDELAADAALDPERAFDLKVAVSEACANAVEHSGGKRNTLEICASIYKDRVVVEISDSGDFRITSRNPRGSAERGLGLPLMVALMDEVRFFKNPEKGTTVALSLYREDNSRKSA